MFETKTQSVSLAEYDTQIYNYQSRHAEEPDEFQLAPETLQAKYETVAKDIAYQQANALLVLSDISYQSQNPLSQVKYENVQEISTIYSPRVMMGTSQRQKSPSVFGDGLVYYSGYLFSNDKLVCRLDGSRVVSYSSIGHHTVILTNAWLYLIANNTAQYQIPLMAVRCGLVSVQIVSAA